jgi:hypothetical protein
MMWILMTCELNSAVLLGIIVRACTVPCTGEYMHKSVYSRMCLNITWKYNNIIDWARGMLIINGIKEKILTSAMLSTGGHDYHTRPAMRTS